MPTKIPDDSRIISLRLPIDLLERLDRYLDWSLTHQRLKSTRNGAMREALGGGSTSKNRSPDSTPPTP